MIRDKKKKLRHKYKTMLSLIRNNIQALKTLESFLLEIDDLTFIRTKNDGISSIGSHIRHIIEFNAAFFIGLENEKNFLSYDDRPRNILIEKSRPRAINEIRELQNKFEIFEAKKYILKSPYLRLFFQLTYYSKKAEINTTIERELFYVFDHSVHHMAIIKLLSYNLGFSVPEDFGLSISTSKYNSEKRAA